MTAWVAGGATEVSNTKNPDQLVVFVFNPPLGVSAGDTVQFTLKATLSRNTARTDIPVRFASLLDMDPLGRTLPIAAALWLLGIGLLAVPGGLRQRVLLLAALMTLLACTQIGCGNDNSGFAVLGSSEQQVQAGGVVTTNAHGTVSVEGYRLPLARSD